MIPQSSADTTRSTCLRMAVIDLDLRAIHRQLHAAAFSISSATSELEYLAEPRDVVGERAERKLGRPHLESPTLKAFDDAVPAGALGPGSVDEDDVRAIAQTGDSFRSNRGTTLDASPGQFPSPTSDDCSCGSSQPRPGSARRAAACARSRRASGRAGTGACRPCGGRGRGARRSRGSRDPPPPAIPSRFKSA